MIHTSQYTSPLGKITIACDEEAIIGLWFNEQKHFGSTLSENVVEDSHHLLEEASAWLDIYFQGLKPDFTPQVKMTGTEFRKEVWKILMTIPYGKTMTYGQIAKEIAKKRNPKKMSAQAIGGAVGNNPISLIIPCHRVIGKDGNLVGYAGGVDRKTKLLEMEANSKQRSSGICK